MGSRVLITLVLVVVLLWPTHHVDGLEVSVDTDIPGYIMEDHINLTGTTSIQTRSWMETTANDFSDGTNHNTTVDAETDEVRLIPSLTVRILNGGNAVLQGGEDEWDKYILDQVVIRYGGKYWMYYCGGRDANPNKYALMTAYHIGLATSTDGISWTKYSGNPVLSARVDIYDYTNLIMPVVMVENGTFHMYYAGNRGNKISSDSQDINICYATSTDGYDWTKYSGNPVLLHGKPTTAWDGLDIRPTSVFRAPSGKLRMYFKATGIGQGSNLGAAESTDFRTWRYITTKSLYEGDPNGWEDGVTNYNHLEYYNGTYRMWTHADKLTWRVGWICSEDGMNWTPSEYPVISPTAGTIYSNDVENPSVVDEGDHMRIYTTCWDGTGNRRVACFEATVGMLNGTYLSNVKDLGGLADLGATNPVKKTPIGSEVRVYLRWSNDSTTWSAWTELDGTREPTGVSTRYVQYKVELRAERDWIRPSLRAFILGYSFPVTSVDYSVGGGPWQSAGGNLTDWFASVRLHDGDYNVRVRATDRSGRESIEILPVKVDLRPPAGILQLEDGRNMTDSTEIGWGVMASDTHGVPFIRVSTDPEMAGTSWTPFASKGVLQYDGPDGNVTVFAELRDGTGRTTLLSDSIWLDTTPPSGNLTINDGAWGTVNRTVDLNISWYDEQGLLGFYVSNYAGFSYSAWMEPVHEMEWDLLDNDGTSTVYVKLVDLVGHETVIWSTILLDTQPPYAAFVINDNDKYTNSLDVHLNVWEEEDEPVEAFIVDDDGSMVGNVMVIEDGQSIPWDLEVGPDGVRTVRMLMRDRAGNEKVVMDSIVLDTVAPGGDLELPKCHDGFTNTRKVLVRINATDALSGVAMYRSREDDTWQPFGPYINVTLSAEEGAKEIQIDLMDHAGNEATLRTSVVLDTTPPVGHIIVANGSLYVNDRSIPVELHFEDGGSDLAFMSNMLLYDGDDPWIVFSDTDTFSIPSDLDLERTEGPWKITYYVQDGAGNIAEANAIITVDLTAPVIEVHHVGGEAVVAGLNEFTVSVFDWWDPSPIVEWRVDGGKWRALEGDRIEIDLDTGKFSIEVRAIDAAGNEGVRSVEEEATLDLVVVSTWLLLIVIIAIVVIVVYVRERRKMRGERLDR